MAKFSLVLLCLCAVLALSYVTLANRRHFSRQRAVSSSSSSSEQSEEDLTLNFARPSPQTEQLSGRALVNFVNRVQSVWKAELNQKFASYDEGVKWRLMGVNHVRHSVKAKQHLGKTRFLLGVDLPDQFDARQNWPACGSIGLIRDQSSCGSCWAFGAVEAMSDRICIASEGKIQVSISADDLLSCCHSCGFGCDGGEPLAAWKYWVKQGIVTGSNYTLNQGCRPYPFPPCEHHSNKTHYQPCKHDLYPTPKCERTCVDGYSTHRQYNQDKFYGKSAYAIDESVKAIQLELYTHGPVEVAFEVYEDFLNYKGGVYYHVGGKLGGGHAVKLLGWGTTDSGVPYWLVANSWNTDWGEDGFFRILRGKDECGIESGAVGGVPDLGRSPPSDEGAWNLDNDMAEDDADDEQPPHHPHRHHRQQQQIVETEEDEEQ